MYMVVGPIDDVFIIVIFIMLPSHVQMLPHMKVDLDKFDFFISLPMFFFSIERLKLWLYIGIVSLCHWVSVISFFTWK